MVRERFPRRVSLKGGANHGWFAPVLRAGCRLKGVQTMDGLRPLGGNSAATEQVSSKHI